MIQRRIYTLQDEFLVPYAMHVLGDVYVVIDKIRFANILFIEFVSVLRGSKPDHGILGRVIAIVGLESFRPPLDKIFAVPLHRTSTNGVLLEITRDPASKRHAPGRLGLQLEVLCESRDRFTRTLAN